jgi:hypothetical protein
MNLAQDARARPGHKRAPPSRRAGARMSPPRSPSFFDNVGLPPAAEAGEAPPARARGSADGGPSSPPGCAAPPAASPSLGRSPSVGSFLDLREANIADDPPRGGAAGSSGRSSGARESESGEDGAAASGACTPRAAPCIALPRQNAELLRHFAIGARPAARRAAPRARRGAG